MDDPYEMPNEEVKDILDRLAQRLGLAERQEVLPTRCAAESFQGRLRNKNTPRHKFCDMKPPCTDCPCDSPKQAKSPTLQQSDNNQKERHNRRKVEVYGGFDKGKISKRRFEKLILLNVTPGFALIDTGAQHGVIGKENFRKLCERLAKQNLRPREVSSSITGATGIGGDTSFLGTYEIPVGVAGCSGVLTLSVTEKNLPPLLPVGFTKRLGMVLDQSENLATWKALRGKTSEILDLDSGHIAMDILEYGPNGWSNPHANPRVVLGDNCVRDETATGADFRLDSEADTSSVPIKAKTKSARKPKTVKTVAFEGDQAEPVLEVCYGRGLDGRQIEYYQPVSAPRPVDLSPTQHYSMEDSCLLYTSPSPRDLSTSRMPSSA